MRKHNIELINGKAKNLADMLNLQRRHEERIIDKSASFNLNMKKAKIIQDEMEADISEQLAIIQMVHGKIKN